MHGSPRSAARAQARRRPSPRRAGGKRSRWTGTALRWLVPTLAGAAALGGVALQVRARARKAERQHPPAGRFMTVDGVRLHYVVKGSGEPIVIFHGNGSLIDDMVISGLVDLLARNHRVVVFDRPGFGYSGRPRSRLWTPHAQAALLGRALDRLQLGSATLIGHSWGTLVAVAMALSKPSRVRGLVLVSGYYYPEARADVPVASAPAVPLVGDVLRYTVAPVVSSLMLPRIYKRIFAPEPVPARFERNFPHELVFRPSHLRAASADSALLTPATLELKRHYRELNLPVAILAGEGDQIVDPARHSLRLHRELPQSTCRIVPRLGHMMHYGGLDAIADAVAEVEHAASGVADLQNA